jgi:hypothetical protein
VVRVKKQTKSHVGSSRLHFHELPKKRLAVFITAGLTLLGFLAVLVSYAGDARVDTIVAVGDEGGFNNSLIAVNPTNGAKLGALTLPNLPNLAGCAPSQPKPYIYDLLVNIDRGVAIAGLKPCSGARLNGGQVLGRFDLVGKRFDAYLDGPVDGILALQAISETTFAALNNGATEVWIYDYHAGVKHKVSLAAQATRFGMVSGSVTVAYANGTVDKISASDGKREQLGSVGVALPKQSGSDGLRIIQSGDTAYVITQNGNQSSLISINMQGQVHSYPIASIATSFDITPNGAAIIIATGCPSGNDCVPNPNRLYVFTPRLKAFQSTPQADHLPLATSPSRVRFDSTGENLFFDGVVAVASGAGQRFVFSLDLASTQLLSARVAVPSSVWLPVGIDPSGLDLGSQTPAVDVDDSIPSGGGIGGGGISGAPIPIDEIERLLGMSIWEIDWSKVSDEQIRAYGYDPAEVRRYVAQMRLQVGAPIEVGNSDVIACHLGDEAAAQKIAAIESVLGTSLAMYNFDQVSDEQIRAFGYDPAEVRKLVADYKAKVSANQSTADPCANLYTQDAFVVDQGSNVAPAASGSVVQVTAKSAFDLFRGGWHLELRWQDPGGATKFHIYGRDNKTNTLEKRLATVDSLKRSVKFGGFGRMSFAPLHSADYTLAVVPEGSDGKLGAPTAIKTKVNCYVVWCFAQDVKNK